MSSSLDSTSAQTFHVKVTTLEKTGVQLLCETSGFSASLVKQAMQKGSVWHTRGKHTQRIRRAKKSLQIDDELHLYFNQSVLDQTTQDAILISDEGDYSVWYKPFAMLCLGSKWSDHTTINRFVETHLEPQRPAFIVHRLDKATTGLIVIAHSKKSARSLSNSFEARLTKKKYQAVVHGDFRNVLKHDNDCLSIDEPINNKTALSHVKLNKYDATRNQSLLDIQIDTGRKHQIRIHLSNAGFPIVGDRLHGDDDRFGIVADNKKNLQLSSVFLSFPCPNTQEVKQYLLDDHLKLKL